MKTKTKQPGLTGSCGKQLKRKVKKMDTNTLKNRIDSLVKNTRDKFLKNSCDSRGGYACDIRTNGAATFLNRPIHYGWSYGNRDWKENVNKELALHQFERLMKISKKIYNS